MDTEFLAQRLQCSRTDKQDCLLTVRILIELAFFARDRGLVDLDRMIHQDPIKYCDPFLKKAVSCIVDIGNADLIRKILYNYILAGNYTGHQFLQYIVITETALAIQRSEDIDTIFSFLVPSFFGLDFENQVLELYQIYKHKHGVQMAQAAQINESGR